VDKASGSGMKVTIHTSEYIPSNTAYCAMNIVEDIRWFLERKDRLVWAVETLREVTETLNRETLVESRGIQFYKLDPTVLDWLHEILYVLETE
jgi:hypothetical protein